MHSPQAFAESLDRTVTPSKFSYDSDKQATRPKFGEFGTLKEIVRNLVAARGARGMTAGTIGFELGAQRKAVNAALYACEKDGTAWAIDDKTVGEKVRWQGEVAMGGPCDAKVYA